MSLLLFLIVFLLLVLFIILQNIIKFYGLQRKLQHIPGESHFFPFFLRRYIPKFIRKLMFDPVYDCGMSKANTVFTKIFRFNR